MQLHDKIIESANIIRFAAGTTGYKGGDSGAGGRTVIEIEDLGATDINFEVDDNDKFLRIELGGDTELSTTIQGLEFILKTLKKDSGD